MRHPAFRPAVVVGVTLLCSVLWPVIPIVLGVFLIVAVAIHAWSSDLRPYVQPLLRVPVARAGKRHARLALAAGLGVLLIVCGSTGATIRGQIKSQWEQRERRREVADQDATGVLDRAKGQLSVGNVDGAEFALLSAGAIPAAASGKGEVDDLLERVRLSGDKKAILDILVKLPAAEFEAFEKGQSVPKALQFSERALNARAYEIALGQLEEARNLRGLR